MNLIERLGGYEKAKQKYSERPFDLAWSDIGKALLEHRRENNIFEMGDAVVCESFKGLIKVIDILEDRLVVDTGIKTAPNSKNTMAMALPSSMFRHATDKEIAQWYRDEAK